MLSSIARKSSASLSRRMRVPVVVEQQLRNNQRRAMGSNMPVPQSMEAKLWQGHPAKEGWESTITWWYTSSFILLVGILGFAPETEITAWAKQEAAARLHLKETGAINELEFGKHYQSMVQDEVNAAWDSFTVKSLKMNDDDDDEDEDDDDDE